MHDLKKDHLVLVFAFTDWFLILSGRYAISLLLVHIEASFHMDYAVAGMRFTAM